MEVIVDECDAVLHCEIYEFLSRLNRFNPIPRIQIFEVDWDA